MVGGGDRELELDAVRLASELEHRHELLIRETSCSRGGHRRSVVTPDYAVDVILYNSAVSGNCYKVRLLFAHRGIEYETVEVSVVDRSNRSEVLGDLNPGLRVPTLVLDDGRPLGESNAILWYFGDGTQYVPEDAYERAQVLQWQFFEQYSHEPYIAVARFWLAYSERPREEFADRLPGWLKGGYAALDAMEAHLGDRAFLVGDRYSLADISLYAYTHVAEEGEYELERYPAIRAWLDRVAAQPGHVPIDA
jgi:glutathione S-transferase